MTLLRRIRNSIPIRGTVQYVLTLVLLVFIAARIRTYATDKSTVVEVEVSQDQQHDADHMPGIGDQLGFDTKQEPEVIIKESARNVDTVVVMDEEQQEQLLQRHSNDKEEDGYYRAGYLRKVCSTGGQPPYDSGRVRVSYDNSHHALFCPLCKMASTFWTRVFKMMELNRLRANNNLVLTPFDVPISQAPGSRQYLDLQTWRVDQSDARNSFKFMFVRNPYAMLFSAYVDKVVGPNPTFWKLYGISGVKMIRQESTKSCGSDLTFSEFLQWIVRNDESHKALDCHVAKYEGCRPCATNYTYIGKMETFKDDAFQILSKLHQTQTLDVFNDIFSELYTDDAIDDSISGPFSWKREIMRCITWPEALKRVWRKLQIRGIIGTAKFPLSHEEALTIGKDGFKEIVVETRKSTSSLERSELKRLAFREAFKSVPTSVLEDLTKVYANEFRLFDYDTRPTELFLREKDNAYHHGFLNYTNIHEDIKLFVE